MLMWAISLGVFAVALSVASVNAAVTTDDQVNVAIAIITNSAVVCWSNGEMPLESVTTVVTMPEHACLFGPNGGEWAHQYRVRRSARGNGDDVLLVSRNESD